VSTIILPALLASAEEWLLRRAWCAEGDKDREQATHVRAAIIAFRSDEWRLTGKRPQVPDSAAEWLVDLAWNGETRAKTLFQWLHAELLLSVKAECSMVSVRGAA
jgi:hypothetical protein